MNQKKQIKVDDAYALKTPADSVRLYAEWAPSYDSDLVDRFGYVAFLRVSEVLLQQRSRIDGAVLDVGCGTGLVGGALRDGGIDVVDGIDISPEMLAEAGKKTTQNGDPVYRNLIAADLTKTLDIPDNQYAGLISAGTFTHGHLGPDCLNELWRVAAPGAQCVIGVRNTHYEQMGFEKKLSADVSNGVITVPRLLHVKMYSEQTDAPEHADDKAFIVRCTVL